MSITAFIGIGSNVGDKMSTCRNAAALLSRAGRVVRMSSLYRTEPVGYENQEAFVNAVVEIETDLAPRELLITCQGIENELGRIRTVRWGPRTIDLDILLYGDCVVQDAALTIPHPLMTERGFVLVPLCEIAEQAMHPILKKTVKQLLLDLRDPHRVARCGT